MKLPAAFFFLVASLPAAAGQSIYCDPSDKDYRMCLQMKWELEGFARAKEQERQYGGPRAILCDPRKADYDLCKHRRFEQLKDWTNSKRLR
jgi:hypothetical protein